MEVNLEIMRQRRKFAENLKAVDLCKISFFNFMDISMQSRGKLLFLLDYNPSTALWDEISNFFSKGWKSFLWKLPIHVQTKFLVLSYNFLVHWIWSWQFLLTSNSQKLAVRWGISYKHVCSKLAFYKSADVNKYWII